MTLPAPGSLLRALATVGGATLISRLFGFLRDVGIAAALGTGVIADAFFMVLQLANFFRRLLAEGALNSAFVPVWLRIKATEGEARAWRFFRGVFEAMALGAVALALLGMAFAHDIVAVVAPGFSGTRAEAAADYLALAAPYVVVAAALAVLAALLNAEHRVGAVALGVIVFNAAMLAALGVVFVSGAMLPPRVGAVLAQAIVAGGLAQFAVVLIGFLRLSRPAAGRLRAFALSRETARFFALAVPGLVAAGIPQLKLIAGAMIASSSQAAVSWLYYANRLYELPLGIAAIAIASVIAPRIAATVLGGDDGAVRRAQSRAFEIALGLALPAAAGFAVLAGPIAAGLFERGAFDAHDSAAVAAALAAICAGLPGHVAEKVLGAISFAHEDTRTPMLAALTGLAAAVLGGLWLFPAHGATGVAAAIALSGWVGAGVMAVVMARRGWLLLDAAGWRRLGRIVLAAALMAGTVVAARAGLDAAAPALPRLLAVVMLVGFGFAVYMAALHLMRVAPLGELRDALRAAARRAP